MQKEKEEKDIQRNNWRIWLVIMIVGLNLLMGISAYSMGVAPTSFFLDITWPRTDHQQENKQILKQSFYLMTAIKIDDSMPLLRSIVPRKQNKIVNAKQLAQVQGYFTQDENTYLTQQQMEKERQEEVKKFNNKNSLGATSSLKNNDLQIPDLTNIEDVYTHYFSASDKMDFGMDMLERWDFESLAKKEISIKSNCMAPQILIFHTHAREDYIGGKTVVDIGKALKQELETHYGVKVLHITDEFYEATNHTKYVTQGEYERMEPVIKKVLEENPSICVALDIHRDGVDQKVHLVTDIEGKPATKIMFVNGLCLNRNLKGEVEEKKDLPNPYLEDNLAFSLQSIIAMNQLYPGLSRKIYLNEWRYSTHLVPQSLLVEWGANTNTWEEAYRAVAPMARTLMTVLQKD